VFVSTGKLHHDRRIPLPGFDKARGGPARAPACALAAGMPRPAHTRETHMHARTRARPHHARGARRITPPPQYGVGYVESPPTPNLQAELGLKPGVVTSGDSLDYTASWLSLFWGG
jgi:hypothetical protein